MPQQYQPGQRWISDSEAELGLGTVLTCDGRLLTLLYPSTGETRQYSQRNAPLTRVRFVPGDEISHFEDWRMTVHEIEEKDGLLIYHGFDQDNQACSLPETELSNFIQFRLASDRLLAGQVDPLPWFNLRYRSLLHRSEQQQSDLWGLAGARAQPIAHQLHIAQEVADRAAPRVLLADEVGLGKTIEAGLIIHRQILSGRASRVLLIVPEALMHQWLVELLRRFNLSVTIFDETRIISSDAENPFEDAQIALLPLNWITENLGAQQLLLAAHWDILVVDEAHHLRWDPEQPSPAYQMVEQLAQQIASVLLLTATPEQLGQESHFARLRLLDPVRYHDPEKLQQESQHYQTIANAVAELLEEQKLSSSNQDVIENFLGEEESELVQAASQGDGNAVQRLIRALLDRHGTGRILFRNTRATLGNFPERILHPHPLPLPAEYQNDDAGLKGQIYPELYFQSQQEKDDPARWWQVDPRIDWLIEQLKELKNEKTLLICASSYTALDIEEALRVRTGIAATTFHEGMSIVERDRAAAWFADEEYGAQILLCSEIGSEGRNFQFSHHLILFDLPQHPDLLEQRIGRLDRIGQKHAIQIHVPYFVDSAQQRLFQWYHQAHNAFLSTSPTAQTLEAHYQDSYLPLLQEPKAHQEQWHALLEEVEQARLQLSDEMQQGRDRLLEINSNGLGNGERFIEAIEKQERSFDLPIYMERLYNAFGIESEDHSENAFILRPGEKMLDASFPLGNDEAVTITYDRELALAREDMQFITWEHPMVQGGMDLVLSGSMGNTGVALLKNKAIPAGTILVELIFVSEAVAPKYLQLTRYMPATIFRCVLDDKGRDLADKVSFDTLDDQLRSVPRSNAAKFARAQREQLTPLLDIAEKKIQAKHQERSLKARTDFSNACTDEINRLTALQKVNPNVRDDEIEILKRHLEEGLLMLDKAAVRLEALRILVAG